MEVEEDIGASISRKEDKTSAYQAARRSLRVWPVSREGDLRERTTEFLVNELLLDQQHAEGLSYTVKRIGNRRNRDKKENKIKDEVLITFATVGERDDVRSFARNLERKGRGVSLEVPDHLWPSFRVLQEVGYELKQKNSQLKRNILFDDEAMDLKMDISTGQDEWKTVLPAGARESLRKLRPKRSGRSRVSTEELDSMLGDAERPEENMEEEY